MRNIGWRASWHERPGLKPKLCGSNFASHSGSAASLTSACVARSCMTGMPSGRFSGVPGLSIHTRRTGFTGVCRSMSEMSFSRGGGVRFFTPSTPAVFFPVFSCVTLRTARLVALGRGEEFLEPVGFLYFSTGRCLIDSSLELEHSHLQLAPGDGVPFIPMTCIMAHDISTLLDDSIVNTIVPLWAYPSHYRGPSLRGRSLPPHACGFA